MYYAAALVIKEGMGSIPAYCASLVVGMGGHVAR